MKLRDLISEMAAHLGEWDNATKKLAPGFKPKAAKKPMHHPMHNKVGPSTTAPTRKVAPGQLPKSH